MLLLKDCKQRHTFKGGVKLGDLEFLKKWIGQRESAVDYVTIPAVQRLAATLDRDDSMPSLGDPLPYGWHLIFFPRVVRHSQLGADGHPERGDFLPPVPLPRRMFAGRRLTYHDNLVVGDEVKRDSAIKDISIKQGRSGQMVFVTLKMDISSPRGLAISEETDVVYRGEPDASTPPQLPQPAPGKVAWSKTITPDPVMLFRYVALGFVGHRIHYDYPYVTQKEGYQERVVPAGLHTMHMFELARAHLPAGLRYKSIGWRAVRALFAGRPFTVCGEPAANGKSVKLWVMNDQNALALSATAEFL